MSSSSLYFYYGGHGNDWSKTIEHHAQGRIMELSKMSRTVTTRVDQGGDTSKDLQVYKQRKGKISTHVLQPNSSLPPSKQGNSSIPSNLPLLIAHTKGVNTNTEH